jgi:hypothetical protein
MNKHTTTYSIQVDYCEELDAYISTFVNSDPAQYGEGETRYEAIDNLLSNCTDKQLNQTQPKS